MKRNILPDDFFKTALEVFGCGFGFLLACIIYFTLMAVFASIFMALPFWGCFLLTGMIVDYFPVVGMFVDMLIWCLWFGWVCMTIYILVAIFDKDSL